MEEEKMTIQISKTVLAQYIDHTMLKADATEEQIKKLCSEAMEYHFKTVCVNTAWVSLCADELTGSDVPVSAVVGFPLGANLTEVKAKEALCALTHGAREVDMVMNIGFLKSGMIDLFIRDIRVVVNIVPDTPVKVIIETCLLTDEEKELACRIAVDNGACFVKTSTGFNKGGATVEDVRLMRSVVGDQIGVKAAGGIRDYGVAIAMIEAGATRIGCSASIEILSGAS